MNTRRTFLVLCTVLLLVGVSFVGSLYLGLGMLNNHTQGLIGLKAKSMALEQERQSLVTAKREISKYAELEKITRTVVPEDKNQAEAVGEIVKIADKNGVALASITFPASTLGSLAAGASGASSASGGAATAGTTATVGLGDSPAAKSKTSALSQLQPVKNIPGVYLLEINVKSSSVTPVSYNKFIAFLADLERNRRTAQVSSIGISPALTDRSKLTFSLTIDEYIKP